MADEREKVRALLEKADLGAKDWGEICRLACEAINQWPGAEARQERLEAELMELETRYRDLDIGPMLSVLTKHAVCLAHGNYSRREFDRGVDYCWGALDRTRLS